MVNIAQGCRVLMLELYNLSQKSRLDEHVLLPEQVSTILKVDLQGTISIVESLEAAGYIKCGHPVGKPYSWIKLTRQGMQLVMNKAEFDRVFQQLPSPETEVYSHLGDLEHAVTANALQGNARVKDTTDVLRDIKESLPAIIEALDKKEDGPLREYLSYLILQGGIDTTLMGVKALLIAYGIEI